MPNPKTDEKSTSLDRDEHISKGAVGAKKVVLYTYDSGSDTLNPLTTNLTPNVDFDYQGIASSGSNEDTITYRLGGAGGDVVRTIVVTYPSGAERASDSVSSVEFS